MRLPSACAIVSGALALCIGMGLGCQNSTNSKSESENSTAGTPSSAASQTEAIPAPYSLTAESEQARHLATAFASALEPVRTLSAEELRAQHRPSYLPAHGLSVHKAAHYTQFVEAFDLDPKQRERLDTLGFVVVPHPEAPRGGAGPVDLYYRVFAADLPVFVSADSILHAWHRSYDDILEATEQDVLLPALEAVLAELLGTLSADVPAQRDAAVYTAVALGLLRADPETSPEFRDEVAAVFSALERRGKTTVALFGDEVELDPGMFKPRGHYTHSPQLERYFRAMMWLARAPLRLYDPNSGTGTNSHPREEAAARALVAALFESESRESFELIEDFYHLHVGRPTGLGASALLTACNEAGLTGCRGEDGPAMQRQYAATSSSASHEAQIVRRPTLALRMLPQRFAIDSWVTANTTSPQLPAPSRDRARTMASELDVAFALGSDRALEYLAEDLDGPKGHGLPGRLQALRDTLTSVSPTDVEETIYNHWLRALMAVGKTDLDARLPRVMRTAAWHDHRLETMLASWAELRHDTILIVEQSEGSFGCQYPQGYVEPLPDLYGQLDAASAHLAALYERGVLAEAPFADNVRAWSTHFQKVMQRLGRLSEQQLRGQPMDVPDLAFLNRTVDEHREGYGGSRSYDGWYPALYWGRAWALTPPRFGRSLPFFEGGRAEPIVSDVHTDRDHGQVLEVGTGYPELMIVVIDQGDDVAVYGGPVSSFYSFHRASSERMTDNEWQQLVASGRQPERPRFAREYRTPTSPARWPARLWPE